MTAGKRGAPCPKCGKLIPGHVAYCAYCGAAAVPMPGAALTPLSVMQPAWRRWLEQPVSINGRWLLLLLLLLPASFFAGWVARQVFLLPEHGTAAGKLNPGDGAEYVYTPPGEFSMGSSDDQVDAALALCQQYDDASNCSRSWHEDEQPQHQVYLDAFWIMRTEVTNAQYGKFIAAGGYGEQRYWSGEGWAWREQNGVIAPRYWGGSSWNGADQPVVGVSWYEAEAYARWLSEETGADFRLPTEAEWEKTARGADGRNYPWGNSWDGSRVNACDLRCAHGWGDKSVDDGYATTAPVGRFPAGVSPYGALDMSGNVWEWVADWYANGYYGQSPLRNPQGPETGVLRGLRGGSWFSRPHYVRAAVRYAVSPGDRYDFVGFRLISSGF